jgi:flagellar basal body P-ring protein FlgI
VFPAQTLISALERMGITVPQTGSNSASNMQVKNMAGVFVVATSAALQPAGLQDGHYGIVGRAMHGRSRAASC